MSQYFYLGLTKSTPEIMIDPAEGKLTIKGNAVGGVSEVQKAITWLKEHFEGLDAGWMGERCDVNIQFGNLKTDLARWYTNLLEEMCPRFRAVRVQVVGTGFMDAKARQAFADAMEAKGAIVEWR